MLLCNFLLHRTSVAKKYIARKMFEKAVMRISPAKTYMLISGSSLWTRSVVTVWLAWDSEKALKKWKRYLYICIVKFKILWNTLHDIIVSPSNKINSFLSEQNLFKRMHFRSSHRRCSIKNCSGKFSNIRRKVPVLESLFNKVRSAT